MVRLIRMVLKNLRKGVGVLPVFVIKMSLLLSISNSRCLFIIGIGCGYRSAWYWPIPLREIKEAQAEEIEVLKDFLADAKNFTNCAIC